MIDFFLLALLIVSAVVWGARCLLRHRWEYRNPFDRTCRRCGRHEVEHYYADDPFRRSFWDVFDGGDGSC